MYEGDGIKYPRYCDLRVTSFHELHAAREESITPETTQIYTWLPVRQRITFKILMIVYKALNGQTPSYVTELLKTSLKLMFVTYRKCLCIRRTFLPPKKIESRGCVLYTGTGIFFFFFLVFFLVSIYGAMPGNVSQLSNQCVDSPLGNYNNTEICLSSWFESNLSNRSQYVVYNNNSSFFFL